MNLTVGIPLVVLFLLFYGVCDIRCAAVPENSTDILWLLNFKQATSDPSGILNNWNISTPLCQWKGVACTRKHPGRVTGLTLSGQGLSGQIAASVGNLTSLRTLDLSGNNFSGPIPPLNNLRKMQFLNLSFNSLGGIIPDTLTNVSSLKILDLYTNLLQGSIPPQIGLLRNLDYLDLSSNILTGVIPSSIRNITELEQIYLLDNQLQGTIPDVLGQLPKIFMMALGSNRLSGSIPPALFNSSSLQTLDIRNNTLSKSLPSNTGDYLPRLNKLYLGNNMLKGHIPASLGNASMLERLVLQTNNFTGRIPTSFGKLSRLSILDLGLNMLEAKDSEGWEFLHALGSCTSLEVLALSGNQLQGKIPNSIGNLTTNLSILILAANKISGTVPQSIRNLSGLAQLSLDVNNLTGTVDEWIGNLKNLKVLDLDGNNFAGLIPPSIGNLTGLTMLHLQKNGFQGPIPHSIGNLQALQEIDLSYNNIQDNIPPALCSHTQLNKLHLSSNKLTGEIPSSLEQCQQLVDLRLDQNFLAGSIPVSLGNLSGLSILNLSHNNLSGTIPKALGTLMLSELDLSYNHLYGEIPTTGVFRNVTAVSVEGNWGLCGATDLHVPLCRTPSKKSRRQYYLIKILIPIFGFLSLLMLVYFLFLVKKSVRRKHTDLISFGENFLKVSYNDLAQATKNFSESNLVGRGSYGSVYRGKLKEQKVEVAVKVFDLEMRGAERSFLAECEALRSIQHRNLLPIITACSTVDNTGNVFKALVYEFMPNGNLDTWIHAKGEGKDKKRLGLTQIINIAVNVADALDYLHHECGRPTIHCDLKPSNILLDDDMNALLGDFGIARFYVNSRLTPTSSVSSIGVKGTIGYIAPEYAQGGHPSTSGDAYSFGIVLLEMMTGKRPTDAVFNDGLDIVNFVDRNFPHQINHVIDAHLKEEVKDLSGDALVPENVVHQCLASLLQIALSCAHPLPNERMNMKAAASKMHAIKTSYLGRKLK